MTVSGGFYSLNGGSFTDQQAMVGNGDEITIALKTGGSGESTAAAQLTVGAYTTTFEVTTSNDPVKLDRTIQSSGGCSVSPETKDPVLMILLLASVLLGVRRKPVSS